MPIIRQLEELPAAARGGAVAIGNFDGVHLGHRRIVKRLLERARDCQGPAIVFTFDPHPVRLLRPEECPPPLTWTRRKAQLLREIGVDLVVAYPTNQALLDLSARAFFESIIVETLAAKALVEGPNFFFGRHREGNVELLGEMTAEAGLTLDVVAPAVYEGEWVSSSRIRRLLVEGDVAAARDMLETPYRIRGMVTHGAGRGAQLGFPTANLEAVDTLLPGYGVYAGHAIFDDHVRAAAIHLGPNPTFHEKGPKVEVHVIDCQENLYGMPLEVEFVERLRSVEKFNSEAALKQQMTLDIRRARDAVRGGVSAE